ncbi:MAG: hypothetical protein RI907_2490 [Pseudomonadota bacterium]|jgi:hypothetical protein
MNQLTSVTQATQWIREGRCLSLAGTEAALQGLPEGDWIAGTIPYFMADEGGMVARDDQVFVTDLTALGATRVATYGEGDIEQVVAQAPANGFTLLIIPFGGGTQRRFAAEAANFKDAFLKPTVGWIAGVHLEDIGKKAPLVYDGRTHSAHEDRAVAVHITLPEDKLVQVDILNLFEPDGTDLIQFDQTAFTVDACRINGEPARLSAYVRDKGLEHGRLPLMGDFAGAHINVSLQRVHEDHVDLFAPVFQGVDYHFAKPVGDYAAAFRAREAHQATDGLAFSCNCILNYVFGELQGKVIGGPRGPFTFGEIGYQLLNQTQVAVRIL